MSDEADRMNVDEEKFFHKDEFRKSNEMEIDDSNREFRETRKVVGFQTPAPKSLKTTMTPFAKRANTFTEHVNKYKEFDEETKTWALEGCKK